ncbi:hypothetical protein B0H13DRAFT_1598446, partial [Mycena leptocephala]
QVFFSEARQINLKRCFDSLMSVIEKPGGVHPKMAKVLETVFDKVERVGGDIGAHKRRKTSQRTWKDSNGNTLYLD